MIRRDGPRLRLSGAVTYASHLALRDAAAALLDQAEVIIDWSEVTAVDSSALALVLHWRREVAEGRLVFEHLPPGLIALADLYGVKDVLESAA